MVYVSISRDPTDDRVWIIVRVGVQARLLDCKARVPTEPFY